MQITGGENRMEKYYYRVCTSLNDKGVLIPEGSNLDKYKKGEAYISAFKYNENHKDLFKKTGSVAGITDVVTDILYFDLDNKDLEVSRKDTITVVERLESYGISSDQLRIDFSGSKGLHIAIHTTDSFSPQEARSLATSIAGDLPSFDSSIYNANRIMRIEGSIHAKTNLRKTPLSFDELKTLTIDDIKALSTEEYEYTKPPKVKLPEAILKLKSGTEKEVKKEVPTLLSDKVDYLSNPLNLTPWKLAISQGFFPNGKRHDSLTILAATLQGKGFDLKQAYYVMKAAADAQSERFNCDKFNKKEIWSIASTVFTPNWKGGTYAEDNFPLELVKFFDEHDIPRQEHADLVSEKYAPKKFSDMGDVFEDFVKNYEKNVIKTGIAAIDKDMPLTPGMNLAIIGSAGSGKTSLALKVLQYCSENNIPVILASIDMNSTRLYEKILYRITGLNRDELYRAFKEGEADKIKEQVKELFRSVYVYDRSACTIEDLKKYHKAIEKRDGVKIKMTMVDYFERINTDVSEDTAASKKVAGEWQDYINDFNIVGVMFVQPNKMGISGGPNTPILEYTKIKGSSFLYQSFRGIISLWRPFYTPQTAEHDKYMQMALLKNDLGELNTYDFGWNGKRGDIYELDDSEKRLLKQLLEDKTDEDDDY